MDSYYNRQQDGHFNLSDQQEFLEMAIDHGIFVTETDRHLTMLLVFYSHRTLGLLAHRGLILAITIGNHSLSPNSQMEISL